MNVTAIKAGAHRRAIVERTIGERRAADRAAKQQRRDLRVAQAEAKRRRKKESRARHRRGGK